jgi:tol-pal system protein YbgF
MFQSRLIFFLSIISFTSFALGDEIPIEDFSMQSQQPIQKQSSLEQRVDRSEQQMQNYAQMNLPAKIDDLQQQIQQLRGELEIEEHNVQLLNETMHNFYQDLYQRINAINEPPTPAVTTTSSENKNNPIVDKQEQDYKTAFNLLSKKKYDNAIIKMQEYLTNYSNGKYAVNAHFWLGEIYYLQFKLKNSINEFQIVINQYPNSAKVPDAMLKLGIIYSSQGNYDKSRREFQLIKTKFPNSPAAHLMEHKKHG